MYVPGRLGESALAGIKFNARTLARRLSGFSSTPECSPQSSEQEQAETLLLGFVIA